MVYDDRTARKVEQAVSDVVDALRDASQSRYGAMPLGDVLDRVLDGFRTPLPASAAARAQRAIDKAANLFHALGALRDRACFLTAPITLPVWDAFLRSSREMLAALHSDAKDLPEIEYHYNKWIAYDYVQDALTAFPAEIDQLLSEGIGHDQRA